MAQGFQIACVGQAPCGAYAQRQMQVSSAPMLHRITPCAKLMDIIGVRVMFFSCKGLRIVVMLTCVLLAPAG